MPVGNKLWLRIGGNAPLPLTYVENCAQAIVLAAENTPSGTTILNVVDDNPPSQRRYAALARSHVHPSPLMLPRPPSRPSASSPRPPTRPTACSCAAAPPSPACSSPPASTPASNP